MVLSRSYYANGKNNVPIADDYRPYIDRFGLVQPEPDTTSDNGIRFTTEALIAMSLQYEATHEEYIPILMNNLIQAIIACQVKPGLLTRSPVHHNQEGPDDYYAAACIGALFHRPLAQSIYDYGMANSWCFNNVSPNEWNPHAWLGRQPALVVHIKNCSGRELNLIEQCAISAGILLSARSSDQDGKILMWFCIKAIKGKYCLVDKAIKYWDRKLREKYQGGIGDCLGAYYSPKHWEHPNSKYLMNEFS